MNRDRLSYREVLGAIGVFVAIVVVASAVLRLVLWGSPLHW
jgi:hypothetical protein